MSWFLVWALVYLIVGIVLKNHTRIGKEVFKDFNTRFIFLYAIPLGGLAIYLVGNGIYLFILAISDIIFKDMLVTMSVIDFFPWPKLPKYPTH